VRETYARQERPVAPPAEAEFKSLSTVPTAGSAPTQSGCLGPSTSATTAASPSSKTGSPLCRRTPRRCGSAGSRRQVGRWPTRGPYTGSLATRPAKPCTATLKASPGSPRTGW
jgi:hypothetical protein